MKYRLSKVVHNDEKGRYELANRGFLLLESSSGEDMYSNANGYEKQNDSNQKNVNYENN